MHSFVRAVVEGNKNMNTRTRAGPASQLYFTYSAFSQSRGSMSTPGFAGVFLGLYRVLWRRLWDQSCFRREITYRLKTVTPEDIYEYIYRYYYGGP